MIKGVITKQLKVIPDELRIDPHNNNIPYDWKRKDG